MSNARFSHVDLSYGCHSTALDLPEKSEPIVIAGPNGAGKTTLVEALVRGLFGFDLRDDRDRRLLESRRPWEGAALHTKIRLIDADGTEMWVERQLDGPEVVVRSARGNRRPWKGDGSPRASNRKAREYRQRLAQLFGLDDRRKYEGTACIHQADLLSTRLTDELLKAAAGGFGIVDEARARLIAAHRELTREPIHAGESSGRKARLIERLEDELDELHTGLDEAIEASLKRRPLLEEQERLRSDIRALDEEIEALHKAHGPLARLQELQRELTDLEERVDVMRGLRKDLETASFRYESEKGKWAEEENVLAFPADFQDRADRIEHLWDERKRLRIAVKKKRDSLTKLAGPPLALLAGSVTIALAGVAAWQIADLSFGLPVSIVAAAATTILGLARLGARSRRAHRLHGLRKLEMELQETKTQLTETLEGIPAVDELNRGTLAERLESFKRQLGTEEIVRDAQRDRRGAVEEVRLFFMETDSDEIPQGPEELAAHLDDELSDTRKEIARRELDIENVEEAVSTLPPGVVRDLTGVEAGIEERRRTREQLQRQLRAAEKSLTAETASALSPSSARRRVEALEERLAQLRSRAGVYGRAFDLLVDGYEAFRDNDQQHLLDAISGHLDRLTRGRLGPIEASSDLASASMRAYGRVVPLDHRPMSYGELHATLLAIRLGAADFLAAVGVRAPLIIDEAFAYLDEDSSRQLWKLLCQIASERQVILTTHNCALLERLGAKADLLLEASVSRQLDARAV